MPFTLAPLPYAYEALEPYIDSQTLHVHHDKHHQAYCDNFNAALAKHPELHFTSGEEVLAKLSTIPEDIRGAVRNHGGGYVNHNLYWSVIGPNKGGAPSGAIAEAIKKTFGDFTQFQEKFNDAGAKQFGSGWVWLVSGPGGLQILSTPNQDSPLSQGLHPLMVNDVWEHAYYLKYQNRRADYLKAWWSVVNWDAVNANFAKAK